jgi:hypothetical protein
VLRERYELSERLTFTRTMLWDLEQRKAAAPGVYIPSVVENGSDRSWARASSGPRIERLERCSKQRLWLRPDHYGTVVERAELDHRRQTVTFTGEATITDPDNRILHASTQQPRFHVEHAVGGTEQAPLNLWRIVHLTETEQPQLVDRFTRMWDSPWLPEFIEIYIRSQPPLHDRQIADHGNHHSGAGGAHRRSVSGERDGRRACYEAC